MASQDRGARRVGLVVPPANLAVQLEFQAAALRETDVFEARFPAQSEGDYGTWTGLEGRLHAYLDALPATAREMGGLGLGITYLACTAISYLPAVSDDEQLRTCFPAGCGEVVTAASLVNAHLAKLRDARVAFLTPYPAWLTALALEHYGASGHKIDVVREIRAESGIYAVSETDILAAVTDVQRMADVIVIGGTGVRTVPIVDRLRSHGLKIVSANWLALKHVSQADVPS